MWLNTFLGFGVINPIGVFNPIKSIILSRGGAINYVSFSVRNHSFGLMMVLFVGMVLFRLVGLCGPESFLSLLWNFAFSILILNSDCTFETGNPVRGREGRGEFCSLFRRCFSTYLNTVFVLHISFSDGFYGLVIPTYRQFLCLGEKVFRGNRW